ncbi:MULTISPECIES: hypothetical protein [Altibacter]|uniref:hypothetical protein n=1 Tax=Altibacter TaxID=1535231 RepID=UPI00068B5DD4|nr:MULTISPECIES: hypothetical protein [Altibacter]MCW8980229.1 hypothetical protein [Altibacter sp.]MCW9036649.1 hypothetical protein [Altibacter sp.]
MKKNLLLPVAAVFLSFLLFACVKDTDFDQAEDIALTPVVELDLIYFNLTASHFFDSINNTPVLTVTDTTDIRFLDDAQIQESLRRAEFYFKFTNGIPRTFQVDFQFLSETNDTTYTTQTNVIQGTPQDPVITEFEEVVEGDDITRLTAASKVVVSVTIPSSNQTLEGTLNLQSKTTYYLEF